MLCRLVVSIFFCLGAVPFTASASERGVVTADLAPAGLGTIPEDYRILWTGRPGEVPNVRCGSGEVPVIQGTPDRGAGWHHDAQLRLDRARANASLASDAESGLWYRAQVTALQGEALVACIPAPAVPPAPGEGPVAFLGSPAQTATPPLSLDAYQRAEAPAAPLPPPSSEFLFGIGAIGSLGTNDGADFWAGAFSFGWRTREGFVGRLTAGVGGSDHGAAGYSAAMVGWIFGGDLALEATAGICSFATWADELSWTAQHGLGPCLGLGIAVKPVRLQVVPAYVAETDRFQFEGAEFRPRLLGAFGVEF